MTNDKNIHAGHRERMIEKLLKTSGELCDHELLEILLFSFLPRVDTNAIAHNLLTTFGTLENLFKAKSEDILSVKGIGKKTASEIVLIGNLLNRIFEVKPTLPKKPCRNFCDYKDLVISFFEDLTKERFIILMLDTRYIPITKIVFNGEGVDKVSARTEEILHSFAINKPRYVILCHNHPSGNLLPSHDDDLSTAKFYMICQIQGITLLDHVIVANNDAYSYFLADKIYEYQNKYQLETILRKSEE